MKVFSSKHLRTLRMVSVSAAAIGLTTTGSSLHYNANNNTTQPHQKHHTPVTSTTNHNTIPVIGRTFPQFSYLNNFSSTYKPIATETTIPSSMMHMDTNSNTNQIFSNTAENDDNSLEAEILTFLSSINYDTKGESLIHSIKGDSNVYKPNQCPSDSIIEKMLKFFRLNINWEYRDENHDVSWYVDHSDGCICTYEYDIGEPQPCNPFPKWMFKLRNIMFDKHIKSMLPKGYPLPNSCNINWYKNGKAGIGYHADDEILFHGNELKYPCLIISFSIGCERLFKILENCEIESTENGNEFEKNKEEVEIVIKNMEYVTMEGMFQKYFLHCVPKYDNVDNTIVDTPGPDIGPRINFTWRWIVCHNDDCPVRNKGGSPL